MWSPTLPVISLTSVGARHAIIHRWLGREEIDPYGIGSAVAATLIFAVPVTGRTFQIGGAQCLATRLCEPCSYLDDLLGQ